MSANVGYRRLRSLIFLLLSLMLIAQFPGEFARAAPPDEAASISLQMSDPSCEQALLTSGACSIQVDNLTASGSAQPLSRVEVLVNGKLRVYMAGFFESTAFYSYTMVPGGLKVACGGPNDGGLPNYGKAYVVTANAYLQDGTSASNTKTVYCPGYDGKLYLPLIQK